MGAVAVEGGKPRGVRAFWASLDARQRRTVFMMTAVVGGLNALGFGLLFTLVTPRHYQLGASGVFTVGIGVTCLISSSISGRIRRCSRYSPDSGR